MLALCCCGSFRRAKKSKPVDDKPLPSTPTVYASNEQTCYLPTPNLASNTAFLGDNAGSATSIGRDGDIELHKLIVDDSDDEEHPPQSKRSASGAFDAVKTKLGRRISHEKSMKRRSQSTVGKSEEEIARRAELRRLRAKRIQDELNSDQSNNVSTHTSIKSTRYLSPLIDIGLPGHGPRDTIEFSVTSGHDLRDLCPPPVPTPVSRGQDSTAKPTMKRWSSCPSPIEDRKAWQISDICPRPASASAIAPGQPLARPQIAHCSTANFSINESTLSSATPQDDEVGRRMNDRRDSASRDSQSALEVWLIAQGIRSRDSSTPTIDGKDTGKPIHRGSSVISQRLGGIDSMIKAPTTQQQRHTWIRSQTSAPPTKATNSSSSASKGRCTAELSRPKCKGLILRPATETEDDTADSGTPIDHSSSIYPSNMPSFQPSPTRSKSLVNILTARDLESLELSPFECQCWFH